MSRESYLLGQALEKTANPLLYGAAYFVGAPMMEKLIRRVGLKTAKRLAKKYGTRPLIENPGKIQKFMKWTGMTNGHALPSHAPRSAKILDTAARTVSRPGMSNNLGIGAAMVGAGAISSAGNKLRPSGPARVDPRIQQQMLRRMNNVT